VAEEDVYEKICDFFGFQTGAVADPDNLITAFKQTLTVQDALFYLLVPVFGALRESQLRLKAPRKGFSKEAIDQHLEKLVQEGFFDKHYGETETSYGRTLGAFVAENQVRKKKGTALGMRYAKYWMDVSDVSKHPLPTKTPYARVLPVEETITDDKQGERILINERIESTSQAVPYDFVTEMLKDADLIALAECYCRLSMEMAGQPCEHEKETCFLFNEGARNLIEIGVARQVSVEEALEIVRRCETEGLVHNISNAKGEASFLCNCCPCCCPILKGMQSGLTNVGQPSRYLARIDRELCQVCGTCLEVCYINALKIEDGELSFDPDLCLGCGLCASRCPDQAVSMVLRDTPGKVYETDSKLNTKILIEALFGKLRSWIVGK
jgi:ferredoxin